MLLVSFVALIRCFRNSAQKGSNNNPRPWQNKYLYIILAGTIFPSYSEGLGPTSSLMITRRRVILTKAHVSPETVNTLVVRLKNGYCWRYLGERWGLRSAVGDPSWRVQTVRPLFRWNLAYACQIKEQRCIDLSTFIINNAFSSRTFKRCLSDLHDLFFRTCYI